jgi:hypothetical protein
MASKDVDTYNINNRNNNNNASKLTALFAYPLEIVFRKCPRSTRNAS